MPLIVSQQNFNPRQQRQWFMEEAPYNGGGSKGVNFFHYLNISARLCKQHVRDPVTNIGGSR